MNLPKWTKKRSELRKIKLCQYPGCEREFLAHPMGKYCPIHSNPHSRKRNKKEEHPYKDVNQEVKYRGDPVDAIFTCALEGCENIFKVRFLHTSSVYPKYCEEHRNEYRRNLFLKNRK